MEIEIIRLGDNQSKTITPSAPQGLAALSFSLHNLPTQPLSIWMMSAGAGLPLLPWWTYDAKIDEDVKKLNDLWMVNSAQSFFDCIFLSQLKRAAGLNFYAIVPGYLRSEGWKQLPESARNTYLRGQGCVYRLDGAFSSKLSINWVPFAQPQCVVRDPSFQSFWPMFVASRTEEDVATSIGFFSLSDPRKLPKVISLLINANDNRSIDLSEVVDWFGLYSSPTTPEHASCAVVYAKEKSTMSLFTDFQAKFQPFASQIRTALQANPSPQTVFKILSRYVPV